MAKVSDDDMALMGRLLGRGEAGEKGAARIAALLDALNESESKLSALANEVTKTEVEATGLYHRLKECEGRLEAAEYAHRVESGFREQMDAENQKLRSRLDSIKAAFRAADGGNDWCDASTVAHWMRSDKWLDLEDAIFAERVVEKGVLGTAAHWTCAYCGTRNGHTEHCVAPEGYDCTVRV